MPSRRVSQLNRRHSSRRWRGTILVLLAIATSMAVPVLLGGATVFRRLGSVPPWVLGGAPALMLLAWLLNAFRVKLLVSANGFHLSLGRAWLISAGGDFGAALGPGMVTGIASYVFLIVRTGIDSAIATALFTLEKLLDLLIFSATLTASAILIALTVRGEHPWRLVAIGFALCAVFLVGIVIGLVYYRRLLRIAAWAMTRIHIGFRRRRRFLRWGFDFRRGMIQVLTMPKLRLALLLTLAGGYWAARFTILPLVALGLNVPVPWSYLIAVQVLALFAGQVSVLPGGTLSVEAVFALLLLPWVDRHTLGLMLLLWRGGVFYFTLTAGGLAFLAATKRQTQPGHSE